MNTDVVVKDSVFLFVKAFIRLLKSLLKGSLIFPSLMGTDCYIIRLSVTLREENNKQLLFALGHFIVSDF